MSMLLLENCMIVADWERLPDGALTNREGIFLSQLRDVFLKQWQIWKRELALEIDFETCIKNWPMTILRRYTLRLVFATNNLLHSQQESE